MGGDGSVVDILVFAGIEYFFVFVFESFEVHLTNIIVCLII